jgi:hypothetical protein
LSPDDAHERALEYLTRGEPEIKLAKKLFALSGTADSLFMLSVMGKATDPIRVKRLFGASDDVRGQYVWGKMERGEAGDEKMLAALNAGYARPWGWFSAETEMQREAIRKCAEKGFAEALFVQSKELEWAEAEPILWRNVEKNHVPSIQKLQYTYLFDKERKDTKSAIILTSKILGRVGGKKNSPWSVFNRLVTEAEPESEEFIEIGRQLYFEGYSARLKDNWWLKELNGYFFFF